MASAVSAAALPQVEARRFLAAFLLPIPSRWEPGRSLVDGVAQFPLRFAVDREPGDAVVSLRDFGLLSAPGDVYPDAFFDASCGRYHGALWAMLSDSVSRKN